MDQDAASSRVEPGFTPREPPWTTDTAAQIPLLIGVTGHRDLVAEEVPRLREAVKHFLSGLQQRFPEVPLRVASSLSVGADLLVMEEALALGLECVAVLPLPLDLYREDFTDPAELARFDAVLGRCQQRVSCPLGDSGTRAALARPGAERNQQYALAGELVASHSFILLALWDGRAGARTGDTGHVVKFRLERRAWMDNHTKNSAHEELLPNLPPDLVYHIVTSRMRGAPAPGLAPLQEGYRADLESALERHLPAAAALVAKRTAELDRELRRHSAAIARTGAAADLMADLAAPPAAALEAAHMFVAVDWFAKRMRRLVTVTLYCSSALMIAMGALFLGYEQRHSLPVLHNLIVGFLGAFVVLIGTNIWASRRQWHRRYLESRALAEGLRVELFWAIAGVGARTGAPAAHRGLLKQADPGLEWIPNAIRATSLSLCESRNAGIPGGVDFTVRKWVGAISETGTHHAEQLHYYWHASRAKARTASFAERLADVFVVIGVTVAAVLSFEELTSHDTWREGLIFCIGLFSLVGGVIEALVQKTADRELQRQYEYMYELFLAAHDRLIAAHSEEDKRVTLALLGRAALEEHAAWLLVHRDRPVYRSRIQ